MFLLYLWYRNLPFKKNLTQALQSNIISAHKVITGFFKKSKSKPSKKNTGILKQYSGGIPPEFQR